MAEAGLVLGMDRFGLDSFGNFADRADLVVELCRRGLADSMVLSHDGACYTDWFAQGYLERRLKDWHYLHVSQDVVPYLLDHGVTQAEVDAMLIANPARVLASQA